MKTIFEQSRQMRSSSAQQMQSSSHQVYTFNHLVQHITRHQAIETLLVQYLQEHGKAELLMHCRVIRYEHGELVIALDNSSFAMPLRFMLPELVNMLKRYNLTRDIKQIRLYIREEQDVNKNKKTKPRLILSTIVKNVLNDLAGKVKNEQLKAILFNLAK